MKSIISNGELTKCKAIKKKQQQQEILPVLGFSSCIQEYFHHKISFKCTRNPYLFAVIGMVQPKRFWFFSMGGRGWSICGVGSFIRSLSAYVTEFYVYFFFKFRNYNRCGTIHFFNGWNHNRYRKKETHTYYYFIIVILELIHH